MEIIETEKELINLFNNNNNIFIMISGVHCPACKRLTAFLNDYTKLFTFAKLDIDNDDLINVFNHFDIPNQIPVLIYFEDNSEKFRFVGFGKEQEEGIKKAFIQLYQ